MIIGYSIKQLNKTNMKMVKALDYCKDMEQYNVKIEKVKEEELKE